MTLVRIGKRTISLEHLIEAIEDGAGPGKTKIHLEPGREVDLSEEESRELRDALRDVVVRPSRPRSVQGKPAGRDHRS